MNHNYIFDVDGTLTPSRGTIDPNFAKEFLQFAKTHRVFLVTGSDKTKTVEQIGTEIYNACMQVFNCSGNDVYYGEKNLYTNDWVLPTSAHDWLSIQLRGSAYPIRAGKHFEHRTGMCNFSVVGRGANQEQRKDYFRYDCESKEREKIAQQFNLLFPKLQADVGGATGIDIFKKGCNKGQILKNFSNPETIKFYGDRTDPAGNDYSIACLLETHQVFAVDDWEHTQELLKNE